MEYVPQCSLKGMLSISLLLALLCDSVLGRAIYTPPSTSNTQGTDETITPLNAADIRALWGRRWNLSSCFPGIQIRIGGKMINKNSFYCTKSDAMKLATFMDGEPLPDRVYVWCRMALLYHSLSANLKIFDVEKLNLFDGDIILSRENVDAFLAAFYPSPELQYEAVEAARDYKRQRTHVRLRRKAVADRSLTWDNAMVPFSIDDRRTSEAVVVRGVQIARMSSYNESLTGLELTRGRISPVTCDHLPAASLSAPLWAYSLACSYQKDIIYEAISQWEQSTCVRFQERTARPFQPHVFFMGVGGCSSSFGKQSRGQFVYLGEGCEVVGIAAHEIGHALGFYHEHARPDRDRYISIAKGNIEQRYHRQFVKSDWTNSKTLGIPYDYSSVLHYASTTFAGDKQSIVTKDPEMQKVIGQREGPSFFDLKIANILYCSERCEGRSLEWSECKHGGYRNPNNCSSCLCPRGLAPPRCESPSSGVNADCSRQILEASSSIQIFSSPGYNGNGFPADGFCSWLIKASSPGKQIRVEFSGNFDFNEEGENSVCYDYVEVRYKGLERAGPRFCGKARPTKTFISHGEELLLSIKTDPLAVEKQGFRVKYSEERCGGCSVGAGGREPPCLRVVKYSCGPRNEGNFCYREERFCCDGYYIQGNTCAVGGSSGIRVKIITSPPSTTPTRRQTTTTTTTTRRPYPVFNFYRPFTRRPPIFIPVVKPRTISSWGPWTPWTACSASCGLCGKQERHRSCLGNTCRGKAKEDRKCGASQCPFQTYSKKTVCLKPGCQWTNPSCLRACYRLATKPRCCVGYLRGDGTCKT